MTTNAKRKFCEKIEKEIETIRNSPYIYQKIVDTNCIEVRKVRIKKYLLFYKINDDKISILRILPEKMDYLNQLKEYKILIQK